MDELTKLIDQMVQEKTFSMEAVSAINVLREKAEAMEETIKVSKEAHEDCAKRYNELSDEKSKLQNQLSTWKIRESEIAKRETYIQQLETAKEVSKAKEDTFRECVTLIFRNTLVRDDMFGTKPMADSSGYVTPQNTSETNTRSEE